MDITYDRPMELAVCRRYRFESAHTLPWHPGKCSRTHGHSYVLEVFVRGTTDNNGVVIEFDQLDTAVEAAVISRLDHSDLNLLLPNPTAENIALWISEALANLEWSQIRLWETENGSVQITR
jgi:6-pyruvoyltetrahydropterin/6-carboxytetrahydropterin synthase